MELNPTPTVVYRYVVQSQPDAPLFYVWDNAKGIEAASNITYEEALRTAQALNNAD